MKYPFVVLFRERSECNIISVKKRRTVVVVFDVQAFSAAFRHLVDETKNAFISASFNVKRGKFKPEGIVSVFINGERSTLALFV